MDRLGTHGDSLINFKRLPKVPLADTTAELKFPLSGILWNRLGGNVHTTALWWTCVDGAVLSDGMFVMVTSYLRHLSSLSSIIAWILQSWTLPSELTCTQILSQTPLWRGSNVRN